MFSRLKNLYNIQKLYNLFRDGIENREKLESTKYWTKVFETALKIKEVREMLAGYKTYLMAALMGATTVAYGMGYIDEATHQMLMGLFGAGAIGTMSAKINRTR